MKVVCGKVLGMYLTLRIKLTTAMLGDQRTREKIRRFSRPPAFEGNIATDVIRWHWLIKEAATALELDDIDPSRVLVEQSYKCPALELYSRTYIRENQRTGKKKREQDLFESIRVGAELDLKFMVTQTTDPREQDDGLRAPTEGELEEIFRVIGNTLGISPWGAKFGYGRFKVLSLTKETF